MIRRLEPLDLSLGKVFDDQPERPEHGHRSWRTPVEVLAELELEERHVHDPVLPGDTDAVTERADGFSRKAAAAESGEGRHAGIVPAGDVPLFSKCTENPRP